ncbi:leucine-rich repeat-containing protein [Anaeramoeba ignava]|uniref:Leucine-rich repeat-containing protein n=1 Tax=Anaeramoeba ignava TaxID=1746090 RepID=A0A9Q0LGG7_ANAIG|nr:leucine-rich repeat-containing protein [Anaeramoeba ignava]
MGQKFSQNENEKQNENLKSKSNSEFCMFDEMPEDILLYIFRFLDQRKLVEIAPTCILFNEIAFEPCLWSETFVTFGKNISHNKIISLKKQVPFLQGIRIKNSYILETQKFIDSIIDNFPNLKQLEINFCKSTELISQKISRIFLLKNLRILTLQSLQMKTFPEYILSLTQLENLKILSNWIEKVPEKIQNLQNLNILRMDFNSLNEFPLGICSITNLTFLTLTFNDIPSIPSEISKLVNLKTLKLTSNKIETLPIELAQLRDLQFLDLSSNKISNYPKELCFFKELHHLDLFSNLLTELPPEIKNLSELRTLNLNHNNIQDLPVQIFQLSRLVNLDIRLNKLHSIPLEIGALKTLKNLTAFGNDLTSIPFSLSFLSLESLFLQGNHIVTLPDDFGDFPLCDSLLELDLGQNQLTELNPNFTKLTKLEFLYLKKNRFVKFPEEIRSLTNLKKCEIEEF